MKNEFQNIERIIDYSFKNKDLLRQAFIHKSYSNEEGCESNQVLEFLGDAVIGFIACKKISEEYGYLKSSERSIGLEEHDEYLNKNHYDESNYTDLKKKLVDNAMLAHRIERLGNLQNYLLLGEGGLKQKVKDEVKTKADLFEAILGAVAVDSNWNLEELEKVVENMHNFQKYLSGKNNEIEYRVEVQKWFQKKYKSSSPKYIVSENHLLAINRNMRFVAKIKIEGAEYIGYGKNKDEAKYECDKKIYEAIVKNDIKKQVDLELNSITLENSINKLQELMQKKKMKAPIYTEQEKEVYDKEGNPVWKCTCTACGIAKTAKAQNKKQAKKQASYLCLCEILEIKPKL